MQFEADHIKDRKKEQLADQIRQIEQHNAEIKEDMDKLQEKLELNGLTLWDLRAQLKKGEE